MLGTLSEPCRGQMSHICDISALRVNSVCEQTITHTFPLLQSEARPHLQNDPDNQ